MKRILLLFLVIAPVVGLRAADLRALWDRANTAYVNENYPEAIACYDSIAVTGQESAILYYNMGNAYFKAGQIGKAILYYNRAQRLDPSDEDIAYNLTVAGSYAKDHIEPIPEFFLKRWVHDMRSSLSSNEWAVASLVLFAVFLAALLLYLLPLQRPLRKTGFWSGVVALLLFLMAAGFASTERREAIDASYAIVMSGAAPVKSSPDAASKDLFVLHEGTKVKLLDQLNGWREIQLADGKKGWIDTSSIEQID